MEKTKIMETKPFEYLVERKYKNYKTIVIGGIIGSTVLFMMLLFFFTVFFYRTNSSKLVIPKLFFLSTGLLLFSSYFLYETKQNFFRDKLDSIKINASVTLLLSIGFLLCQIIAWWNMLIGLNHENMAGESIKILFYLIAFLHFLHAIFGVTFWSFITFNMHERLVDFHVSPLYFTDPIIKSKLLLFSLFWHFVDILWLIIFCFFLFFSI